MSELHLGLATIRGNIQRWWRNIRGNIGWSGASPNRDHIFSIGLVPAPAEIWATSSVSQCLAEAFKCNSKASAPSSWSILEYLKEFDSVFSKESFNALPEPEKWDHADDIFNDLITEGVVVVYLDDILIFTETLEEHQKVTQRVMELLRKNNLLP